MTTAQIIKLLHNLDPQGIREVVTIEVYRCHKTGLMESRYETVNHVDTVPNTNAYISAMILLS